MKKFISKGGQWQILLGILLAIGLCLSFLTPSQAQESPLKTLTVTGQGVETIPTTLAQVNLGVEVRGETATQVQQQVANKTSAVLELVRSRKVEKLQTTGIRLNPQYDRSRNESQPRLTGYIGSNTISFRLKTADAGKLVDEAVKAGATRIDSISFTATDPEIAKAQNEALKKATQDAQQQGNVVLSSLNLSRKDVVSIQINGANAIPPTPVYNARAFAAEAAAVTPIVGGEQSVRATVTLQMSY